MYTYSEFEIGILQAIEQFSIFCGPHCDFSIWPKDHNTYILRVDTTRFTAATMPSFLEKGGIGTLNRRRIKSYKIIGSELSKKEIHSGTFYFELYGPSLTKEIADEFEVSEPDALTLLLIEVSNMPVPEKHTVEGCETYKDLWRHYLENSPEQFMDKIVESLQL